MSNDNRRRIPGGSDDQIGDDSVEQRRKPMAKEDDLPKRRRLSIAPNMIEENPNMRFVLPGFVPRWVNAHGTASEKLYGQDWDFVLDDDGNKIYREASSRRNDQHQQVLMMKRKEFYDADAKKLAQMREDKLKVTAKKQSNPDGIALSNNSDLGLTIHRSGIMDDAS